MKQIKMGAVDANVCFLAWTWSPLFSSGVLLLFCGKKLPFLGNTQTGRLSA